MPNLPWNDASQKMPNFVVDGEVITDLPVEVRHADGREERTIYQGFGHFGYSPNYMEDITHWKYA